MSEYRYLPYTLTPRNKSCVKNTDWSWSNDFILEEHKALMYINFLKCYTTRNNDAPAFEDVSYRVSYYNPYVTASQAREMAKYFRDAMKRKTVYIVDKPFLFTGRYEKVALPITLVITKHPYKEEKLFLEALSGEGIRHISGKCKHFMFKLINFMERSQGYWE